MTKSFVTKISKTKRKKNIPRALREQVWIQKCGKHFTVKCPISWCENDITCFDFHVAHNIPESKGGETNISNLYPICAKCNMSMNNNYTIEAFDTSFANIFSIKNKIKNIYKRINEIIRAI